MKRILLLEDDAALGQGIRFALENNSIQVELCTALSQAQSILSSENFDLLILDVNLPDGSGLDLLRDVRRCHSSVPVILLTANDLETDIVVGLESGADDYITKPFSLAVLRARVNAQLRRGTPVQTATAELEGFAFDFEWMEFRKNGRLIELSKTEQRLLRILVENRGRVLSRETLLERVWPDGAEYVEENTLSVTVKRLRDKLEDTPSKPRFLKTVYGIGYTWAVN
ncbi:MAG: response regulator transcription factor [Oscillospiraceae bacterium]|jgi:DNA-binding response OmpR family regulator|nr:response regulator transcription factor [Oscillospiraceae bacterium]